MVTVVRGSGSNIAIGPLSNYSCDGLMIVRVDHSEKPYYQLSTIETNSSNFDGEKALDGRYKDYSVGGHSQEAQIVYITDEEMEALFLAWQILKEGK